MSINVALFAKPTIPDGFRPPDWRWQLSREGLKAPGDPWGERLLTHRQQPGPSSSNRDLLAAIVLQDGDPLRRAELEARILANEPANEIARKCQLSTAVVVAYEQVFFDVRRRRGASGWVHIEVIRRCCADELVHMWKSFSYEFGHKILDILLAAVDRWQLLELGVEAYLQPESKLPPIVKQVIVRWRSPFAMNLGEMHSFASALQLDAALTAELKEFLAAN